MKISPSIISYRALTLFTLFTLSIILLYPVNPSTANLNLSNTIYDSSDASVAVSANNTYVAWTERYPSEDPASSLPKVLFTKSTDGGRTFGQPNIISKTFNDFSILNDVAAVGNKVYVLWLNVPTSLNEGLFLATSNDNGTSFMEPVQVANDVDTTSPVKMDISSNNTIYVVWNKFDKGLFFSKKQRRRTCI